MAIGLPPQYTQTLPLDDLSHDQFIAIARDAARYLEWNIGAAPPSGFVAYSKFSMSSWSETITIQIDQDKAIIKSQCNASQLIDWGKNKRNVEDFITTFYTERARLSPEALALKTVVIHPDLSNPANSGNAQSAPLPQTNINGVLSIFKPTPGYFVTPIILIINIVIFLLMVFSGADVFVPENESLLSWGANFRPLTLMGEWWRLITCCFIHIGVFHLLMNLYALLYIGLLLEPYLGSSRFIVAYIVCGLCASVTSLWWHDLTISAGASGAIFGLYGVFLAMLTTNLIEKSARQAFLTSIIVFVGYNLVSGLRGGIDNAAHIGGLVAGLITGYALYPSLKNIEAINTGRVAMAAMVVFSVAFSFMAFKMIPDDTVQYQKSMEKFSDLENKALEFFRIYETATQEELLAEIQEKGLVYWNENLRLLDEIDRLDLPEVIREKNKKLRDYCNLRIQSYNLMYKAISENTTSYEEQLVEYNTKIQGIIDELSQK
ncbi:MAG: rhomboid family intramembrane serine protease [Bacteroidota bacterium]